ncbi:MAG: hypothetical protein AAGI03_15905 [Pseudomonadota bacterium]
MDWTVLSEIFRNTTLTVIGPAAFVLALIQYRAVQSRSAFERLHKALELLASEKMAARLSAAGLLIDLLQNRTVRHLAETALKRYIRDCEVDGGVEHTELLHDYRVLLTGLQMHDELEKCGDAQEIEAAKTRVLEEDK